MSDDLAIPAFLDLRIPEVRAKHDQARAEWKPGTVKNTRGEESPRVEYDRKGRALPANIEEAGRAILRSQEREEAGGEKARLDTLHEDEKAKRDAKRAAREAAGDAAAKRKR